MIMVDGENNAMAISGEFTWISGEIVSLITRICKEVIKQNQMSLKECREYFIEVAATAVMLSACNSDEEVESMLNNRAETIFNEMRRKRDGVND